MMYVHIMTLYNVIFTYIICIKNVDVHWNSIAMPNYQRVNPHVSNESNLHLIILHVDGEAPSESPVRSNRSKSCLAGQQWKWGKILDSNSNDAG